MIRRSIWVRPASFAAATDALGIAHRAVEVSGVDQERFTGRVHEQRRVAAFDVHDIDVEGRPGGLRPGGSGGQAKKRGAEQQSCAMHGVLPMDFREVWGGIYPAPRSPAS